MAIISAFPGKSKPKLQAKTVIPDYNVITVTPSSDYEGLSQVKITPVSVNKYATPSTQEQVIKTDSGILLRQVTVYAVPTQAKTVTPSSEEQTVTPDSGKFLSQVTVSAAQIGHVVTSEYAIEDSTSLRFDVPNTTSLPANIMLFASNYSSSGTTEILAGALVKRTDEDLYDGTFWAQDGSSNGFKKAIITNITYEMITSQSAMILSLPSSTKYVFAGAEISNTSGITYGVMLTY